MSSQSHTSDSAGAALERSLRIYRSLLVLYPRTFREEFGEDLVQAFRDLALLNGDVRGAWLRTARDLVSSVVRERVAGAVPPKGSRGVVAVAAVGLVLLLVLIGAPGISYASLVFVVLGVLPICAIAGLHGAWVARRTTGASLGRAVAMALVALVPAAVLLVALGSSRVYWIGLTAAVGIVSTCSAGVVWAVLALMSGRRADGDAGRGPRRRRALLVLVPAAAVLIAIAGASYNSYRKSLGPPGDHSVANASAESRALWEAVGNGDVDEVIRLSGTCADPWVKFPYGNGRHNARGIADQRVLELPDEAEPPFARIREILSDTQDTWYDRCGR